MEKAFSCAENVFGITSRVGSGEERGGATTRRARSGQGNGGEGERGGGEARAAPTCSARRKDPAGSWPGWLSPGQLALGKFGPTLQEPPRLEPDPSRYNSPHHFPAQVVVEEHLLLLPSAEAEGGAEQARLRASTPTNQRCPCGDLETVPAERFHSSKPPPKAGLGESPGRGFPPLLTFSFQTEIPQTLPERPDRGTETQGWAQRGRNAPRRNPRLHLVAFWGSQRQAGLAKDAEQSLSPGAMPREKSP